MTLEDKDEKALNLVLNNKNVQGEYDEEALKLLQDDGVDLKLDGFFDNIDMEMMFGFDSDIVKDVVDDSFRDAMKREHKARDKQDDGDVNYDRVKDRKNIMIVFETNRNRDIFDRFLHLDKNEAFVNGEMINGILTEWSKGKENG